MTSAEQFLAKTPLTALFDIPSEQLDECTRAAYDLIKDGHFDQAEVIARGLVACDHRDWYYRTLLAMSVAKQGRLAEAIATVEAGLTYAPGNPDLVQMLGALGGGKPA